MLTRLKVTNFLLIQQVEIDFHAGLTVITGETGSGKSIIIDAMMILFGNRINRDLIRDTTLLMSFEAEFNISAPNVIMWLEDNNLIDLDATNNLICRRVVDKTFKHNIYINGNKVTNAQIKELGELVLNVHTQHSSMLLFQNSVQRNLLDEYSGVTHTSTDVAKLFSQITQINTQLEQIQNQEQSLQQTRLALAQQIHELTLLNLKPGEWQELELLQQQLTNAQNIILELKNLQSILSDAPYDMIKQLSTVQQKLDKFVVYMPPIKRLITLLNSINIEFNELLSEIPHIADDLLDAPETLVGVEQKIQAIFDLGRKYNVAPEQITTYLEELKQQPLTVDNRKQELVTLLTQYQQQYHKLCQALTVGRIQGAKNLSQQVTKYLHQLAIKGNFHVQVTPIVISTAHGLDEVEYQVAFNAGMKTQALTTAISGGELSRTALALYLLLSSHNAPEIIIFDEIDVGISGKTAATVGEMLRNLGLNKQIICITHQPQTASFGNWHLVINKYLVENNTHLDIQYVDLDNRVHELSRMVGGLTITPTTISHAKEMLQQANNTL